MDTLILNTKYSKLLLGKIVERKIQQMTHRCIDLDVDKVQFSHEENSKISLELNVKLSASEAEFTALVEQLRNS